MSLPSLIGGIVLLAAASGTAVGAVMVVTTSGPFRNGALGDDAVGGPTIINSALPTQLTTIIGGPTRRGPFQPGPPGQARMGAPTGGAIAPDGTIYIADFVNHAVLRLDTSGNLSRFAGSGNQGTTDGAGSNAEFFGPQDLAVGDDGNVYVADGYGNRVRTISPQGTVSTLAGGGPIGLNGGSFADGRGADARFDGVASIAIGSDGDLLVADYNNNRIRRVTTTGTVSTAAGTGAAGALNGSALRATFSFLSALSVAADGTIWIAEHGNNDIRRISTGGDVSTVVGGGPAGHLLSYPSGIAGTSSGAFISDTQGNRILFVSNAGVLTAIAGNDKPGFADGVRTASALESPAGVALMPSGDVIIADKGNAAIRRLAT